MGGTEALSSYNVDFLNEAASDWAQLDQSVRKRLSPAIERLKRDPDKYGIQLGKPLHRLRRIRSGDYRIVYRVNKKAKLVEIAVVCHRSRVYEIALARGIR